MITPMSTRNKQISVRREGVPAAKNIRYVIVKLAKSAGNRLPNCYVRPYSNFRA